jgi:hypothetical protein
LGADLALPKTLAKAGMSKNDFSSDIQIKIIIG